MTDNLRFDPERFREAIAATPVAEIAVAANVSTATIQNWLTGKYEPTASRLAAVARVTGRPLDWFFVRAA